MVDEVEQEYRILLGKFLKILAKLMLMFMFMSAIINTILGIYN